MNENERIEAGDYVRIRPDVEIGGNIYYAADFYKTRDERRIGKVLGVFNDLNGQRYEVEFPVNEIWYFDARNDELELVDVSALDSTPPEADSDEQSWREFQAREAAIREQEHQVWREENKDWIEFQAKEGQPEPDPKDALIAELRADNDALKLDRQRILERNLALTEALEEIADLDFVNFSDATRMVQGIQRIARRALRDEPAADRKAE